jgi:hypothetical protein
MTLRVNQVKSGGQKAVFRLLQFRLTCDDGTTQEVIPQRIHGRFFTARRFQGQIAQRTASGESGLIRFSGRLHRDGTADGTLIYILDPYDPPSDPTPPECTSQGPQPWQASSVE